MFLRVIENKPLFNFIFRLSSKEITSFLQEELSKIFERQDKYLYKGEPSQLLTLNDLLYHIKDLYSQILGSAPPPYVFYLSEKREFSWRDYFLRPGKIYFSEDLREKIQRELSSAKIFYRIETVKEDFYELVLPSTVDPNLILPFKDIFFIPLQKRCFFCRTYLHKSENCPGLKDLDSFSNFRKLLNYSFKNISESLRLNLISKADQEIAHLFFSRNFFLFPSFLKIVFYLYKEIDNFSMLGLNLSVPVRGGDLAFALDYLIHRKFEEAERKFKSIEEEDFRKELGLAFTEFFQEKYDRTLYHLENALSMVNTPFLKGYLYFLKGYLSQYLGDNFTAEENYRLALKEDSSFIPAFYYLYELLYEREEQPEKIFPFFQNPYTIYLAFLEPFFIKHQKELEESLEKALGSIREEISQRLKEAEDKYHKIKELLLEEEIMEIEEKLRKMRRLAYEGGVALIEEAGRLAMELALELNGYILSKIKKYKKEITFLEDRYQILANFWKVYPYKNEDITFGQKLKTSFELIERIQKRLKRSEVAKELKFISKDLEKIKVLLEDLVALRPQLEKKWRVRKKLLKFIKTFFISESILAVIYTLPLFLPQGKVFLSFLSFSSFIILSLILLFGTLIFAQIEK